MAFRTSSVKGPWSVSLAAAARTQRGRDLGHCEVSRKLNRVPGNVLYHNPREHLCSKKPLRACPIHRLDPCSVWGPCTLVMRRNSQLRRLLSIQGTDWRPLGLPHGSMAKGALRSSPVFLEQMLWSSGELLTPALFAMLATVPTFLGNPSGKR